MRAQLAIMRSSLRQDLRQSVYPAIDPGGTNAGSLAFAGPLASVFYCLFHQEVGLDTSSGMSGKHGTEKAMLPQMPAPILAGEAFDFYWPPPRV
jgi:hypothetical protein